MTPPGSMVTIRIRSWRPAMPSISGPRSTVASNFTVTPFVSGATCSLLIVLSSLYFHGLTLYLFTNDKPYHIVRRVLLFRLTFTGRLAQLHTRLHLQKLGNSALQSKCYVP